MLDESICKFVESAFGESVDLWNEEAIRRLAGLTAPPGLNASLSWLIDSDVKALRARWFLEGLIDPMSPSDSPDSFSYPHLYSSVREAVVERAPADMIPDERDKIAKRLASLLRDAALAREYSQRGNWSRETKLLLRELHNRCWICGASFPDWAEAKFLGKQSTDFRSGNTYVDFLKPRGMKSADLQIEIEHVRPLARGGGDDVDNLKLACGWCNRTKSANQLLFDAQGVCKEREHPALGLMLVPQPFWVIRVLAVRRRCEHVGGCSARLETHELTVARKYKSGSPNPSNLMVVCSDHDPFSAHRLVPATALAG
jgi:5-methylcytosine-specific restriction endonuclease McrA